MPCPQVYRKEGQYALLSVHSFKANSCDVIKCISAHGMGSLRRCCRNLWCHPALLTLCTYFNSTYWSGYLNPDRILTENIRRILKLKNATMDTSNLVSVDFKKECCHQIRYLQILFIFSTYDMTWFPNHGILIYLHFYTVY